MSGETEASVSGWTVDTLREHLLQKLADQRDALRQQALDQRAALQQQIAGLQASDRQQIADMREMLNERYATQTKALDAAFLAQQCIDCSVPILCADLVWRPAGDLRVGDELIAFDEDAPPHKGGRHGRSFRRATVLGNRLMEDELLLVDTPYGSVKCNHEHPWLVKDRSNKWVWRRADQLKPGSKVLHIVDVWDVDRSWEGGWLAGMFDGEGWLTFAPGDASVRMGIAQSDGPTTDALLLTIKERLGRAPASTYVEPGRYHNTKGVNRYQISQRADVMKFLGSIRPPRLMVNADRVWEGRGIAGDGRITTVTSVKPIGVGTIASLTTSTATYIGGGFAMHNTAMRTALEAAEKAVATALTSAEKAVAKAEVAADKRFESVNEFRQQLSDQTATFPTRNEMDTRFQALRSDTDRNQQRIGELELRLTSRLDTAQGTLAGGQAAVGERRADSTYDQAGMIARQVSLRANISIAVAAVSVLIALVAAIVLISAKAGG